MSLPITPSQCLRNAARELRQKAEIRLQDAHELRDQLEAVEAEVRGLHGAASEFAREADQIEVRGQEAQMAAVQQQVQQQVDAALAAQAAVAKK